MINRVYLHFVSDVSNMPLLEPQSVLKLTIKIKKLNKIILKKKGNKKLHNIIKKKRRISFEYRNIFIWFSLSVYFDFANCNGRIWLYIRTDTETL